jgi:AcrR family transcriptional regulator
VKTEPWHGHEGQPELTAAVAAAERSQSSRHRSRARTAGSAGRYSTWRRTTIDDAVPDMSTRKTERRAVIVAKAAELFIERGYESTSVNEFADALQMSVGGLYRYITTKADLLTLVCEDIYGELPGALRELVADGGGLLDVCEAFLRACAANRKLILLMYREYRHLPKDAQQRFEDREEEIVVILRELAQATVKPPANPDVLARDIVFLGHLPALKGWALRRQRKASRRLVDEQLRLIAQMAGLSWPEGRRRVPALPSEALSWSGVGLASGGRD